MNVIVTGAGRNKGIGAEICRMLSERGNNIYFTSYNVYDVQVCGINPSEYGLTKEECNKYGNKVYFDFFDLTRMENITTMFDDAILRLGSVDALVNCLCYHEYDSFGSINDRELDTNYQVNTKAILMLCQEFYSRFKGDKGSIVNISSLQEVQPLYNEVSYAITKASILIITSTLAFQMGEKNININAINPGPTDIGVKDEEPFLNQCKEAIPFRRVGTTRDVANLVYFLLSDAGHWISGQTINSEGALYRGITGLQI